MTVTVRRRLLLTISLAAWLVVVAAGCDNMPRPPIPRLPESAKLLLLLHDR